MTTEIKLLQGDITRFQADAIVNAANKTLLGGGGVDGAIHRAAGLELLRACEKLGGAHTGEAKVTEGFALKAKYVIHTVGPIWRGGCVNERQLLAACYKNSFAQAAKLKLKTIAFPSISTGAYRFPIEIAAFIALHATKDYLNEHADAFEKVIFVLFSEFDLKVYLHAYKEVFEKIN